MLRSISRLLVAAGFLLLTALMVLAATEAPNFVFSFYPEFSRKALTALSNITSAVPFALWEIILAAYLLGSLISLIRSFVKRRFGRWIMGEILSLSIGIFLYVGLWGLNYYAPSMEVRMGLPENSYSTAQLKEATLYYREMAQQAAREVDRDADGFFLSADFETLAEEAGRSLVPLAEKYDCFDGSKAKVKYMISSSLMAKTGTTGIFCCLTGESTVSKQTYEISLPFTMCHEVAHRAGFARENEANFAAFLACEESARGDFRYSAYYHAFLYCYNALYEVDPEGARAVLQDASELLRNDMLRGNNHYEELRNDTATEVSDAVYDAYLKGFSVEEGSESYGQVADLLLVWYFEEIK